MPLRSLLHSLTSLCITPSIHFPPQSSTRAFIRGVRRWKDRHSGAVCQSMLRSIGRRAGLDRALVAQRPMSAHVSAFVVRVQGFKGK